MERHKDTVIILFLLVLTQILTSAVSGLYDPIISTSQGEAYLSNYSCSLNHPTNSEVSVCSKEVRTANRSSPLYSNSVTECPRYSSNSFKHCTNRSNLPTGDQFLVRNISPQVMPVNVSLFTIRVHWDWYSSDYEKAKKKLQGYELRIKRDNSVVKCLCIWEPSLRTIDLGLDDNFEYESNNSEMTVELSTFPAGHWERHTYTRIFTRVWPAICTESPVCLLSLPRKPTIQKAVSTTFNNGSREMELSWIKPDLHVDMYYIQLFSGTLNRTMTVFVNGSNKVSISGLPSNIAWSVRIQGYSPCSGLASFYSGASERIGCGEWSLATNVSELVLSPSSTSSTVPSPSPPIISVHYHPYVFVIIIFVAVGCLLGPLVMVAIFIYVKKNAHKSSSTTIIINGIEVPVISIEDEPANADVLVLYSLGTPTQEKVEIEKYIVGYLKKEQFKVISCNDHTEKTVMQWVEENARLAKVIFIVCNEQFSLDWKMKRRSQLVNSIDMIIASAVGQNIIRKYATVLLTPGDKKNIPDNLYFKGMQSFVMGHHATPEERAKFSSFIKLTIAMH